MFAVRHDIHETTWLQHKHISSFHFQYFLHCHCRLNFVDDNSYMYNFPYLLHLYIAGKLSSSLATAKQENKRHIEGFSQLNSANQACKKFFIVIVTAMSCVRCVCCPFLFILSNHTLLWDLQNLHAIVMADKNFGTAWLLCTGILATSGQNQRKQLYARSYILVTHMRQTSPVCPLWHLCDLPFSCTCTGQVWTQYSHSHSYVTSVKVHGNCFPNARSGTIQQYSPRMHIQ